MSNNPRMIHVVVDWLDRLVIVCAVAAFGTIGIGAWLKHRRAVTKRIVPPAAVKLRD